MSSYTDEFNDLATAFDAQWQNRVPVSWPNISFTPPSPAAPWCRFNILNAVASRMTIGAPGANRSVFPGRVVIQIFAPRGQGELIARRYADEASEIFRSLTLPDYRFFLPSVSNATGSIADEFYQLNVDVPFQRDSLT